MALWCAVFGVRLSGSGGMIAGVGHAGGAGLGFPVKGECHGRSDGDHPAGASRFG